MSTPPTQWPVPLAYAPGGSTLPATRAGNSPIEQAAVDRVAKCIACMNAHWVFRLAIHPKTVEQCATDAKRSTSQVHQMLSRWGERPQRPTRAAIAEVEDFPVSAFAILDRPRRPLPAYPYTEAYHRHFAELVAAGPDPSPARGGERDGRSPLELRAVERTRAAIATFPAGKVLLLAIYPYELHDLALEPAVKCTPQALYNVIAGGPSKNIRNRVAKFLGVPREALDHLLDAPLPDAHREGADAERKIGVRGNSAGTERAG